MKIGDHVEWVNHRGQVEFRGTIERPWSGESKGVWQVRGVLVGEFSRHAGEMFVAVLKESDLRATTP